jgi:hypothetical protein
VSPYFAASTLSGGEDEDDDDDDFDEDEDALSLLEAEYDG